MGGNLVDKVWGKARPAAPSSPIRVHKLEHAGQSVEDKLSTMRQAMKGKAQSLAHCPRQCRVLHACLVCCREQLLMRGPGVICVATEATERQRLNPKTCSSAVYTPLQFPQPCHSSCTDFPQPSRTLPTGLGPLGPFDKAAA